MTQQATPLFKFNDRPLDTSPECFGPLRSSHDAVNDRMELHRRMALDGYLFLPGYLDRDEVIAARMSSLERLAAKDLFLEEYLVTEGALKPEVRMRSAQDVALDNPTLDKLLYSGRMIQFYQFFLGGPVRPFNYTWFRAKTSGQGMATEPHCDIVYMGRGTKNLYTSWTPLGDIPRHMGGLIILEKSHLQEELKRTYGQADVDVYCENEGEAAQIIGIAKAEGRQLTPAEVSSIRWTTKGSYADDPIETRNELGGRWLTADYKMGDLLAFSMYTLHGGHDNQTDRIRISTDSRYQLVSDPIDTRWIGDNPPGNDIDAKRGTIC